MRRAKESDMKTTKTYKIGKALLSYSAAMRHLGEPEY
jgi:hypothetical protein